MNRVLAITIVLSLVTQTALAAPAAGVSGLLSIVPGLGQTANGEPLEGLGWFSTTVGLFVSGSPILRQVGYDLWQYNMYDAYRDARPKNGRFKNQSVFSNYVATFNPANLIDPIGAPIFATGALIGRRNRYAGVRNPTYIPYYGFVGMGEEGLFRGFLFPGLSEWFGTFPAAVISSAMFSLFHITNGKGALGAGPLTQRFIGGLLFCWQADLNDYDLRHNIFAHAWFDIFVGPGSAKDVRASVYSAGLKFNFN